MLCACGYRLRQFLVKWSFGVFLGLDFCIIFVGLVPCPHLLSVIFFARSAIILCLARFVNVSFHHATCIFEEGKHKKLVYLIVYRALLKSVLFDELCKPACFNIIYMKLSPIKQRLLIVPQFFTWNKFSKMLVVSIYIIIIS